MLSHHGVIVIASRCALSSEVIERLADRTAGMPLLIEELTRLMLERSTQSIPPTLQQSLAARLDRRGDARGGAQIGADLGREFAYSLISAFADLHAPARGAALKPLSEADLLFVDGAAPASAYRFKHALIRDAAYDR